MGVSGNISLMKNQKKESLNERVLLKNERRIKGERVD